MESECSGWLTEFTNLLPLDDKRRLRRNWSVRGFRKRRMPFHQKWSLPLFWSVASQTIWMDQKINWFTIQPRTLMNLMIQASKTYLNQTLSQNLKVSLFKDTEHFTWIERDTVVILKLPAVQWVEIPVKFFLIAVMLIIQVMNRDFKYWIQVLCACDINFVVGCKNVINEFPAVVN